MTILQTDLNKIRYYAGKNKKCNWDFRKKLKSIDMSVEKTDKIVHALNDKISSQIDCRACANCCREMTPLVNDEETARIARHVGISTDAFREKYLAYNPEEKRNQITGLPCPFLKGKSCTIYEVRPEDCRSFPHLHKEEFVSRLMSVIENYGVCPIVFNVYESLKLELASHPLLDF